jgi:hypothetical protein
MPRTQLVGAATWKMLVPQWWHTTVDGVRFDIVCMETQHRQGPSSVVPSWRLSRDRDCKEISRHYSLRAGMLRLEELLGNQTSHVVPTRVGSGALNRPDEELEL